MEIVGYKCFNNDLINRYGKKFEVGRIYVAFGAIKFGVCGNGFHMCKNLEDTFRYFDAMNKKVNVCLVKGSGEIVEYFDDYNGYYDMYATSQLEIIKKLSREEIVHYGFNLNEYRVNRFISGFRLTKLELEKFKERFKNNDYVLATIEYYQEDKYDAFIKRKR